MEIKLTIPGKPFGKQNMMPVKTKNHNRPIMIKPKETRSYMNLVTSIFVDKYPDFIPLEGPLTVLILAYFKIPKHTSKKKTELMLNGIILPTIKPDSDNISKTILDSLNNRAFRDDAQITKNSIYKLYSNKPRIEITITKSNTEDNFQKYSENNLKTKKTLDIQNNLSLF